MKKLFFSILMTVHCIVCWSQVQIEWQKCLGGTDVEEAQSIWQTFDGGYIIAGYSNSLDGQVTGNHGSNDYWIVKLDPIGNIEWQKSYGGSGDDKAYDVKQTTDSGYVVVGYTKSNDGNVTGNIGVSNFWLIKLNESGNLIWQKCYGGQGANGAFSVQQTFDQGFIITGSVAGTTNQICSSSGYGDYWIVKVDSAGVIQWDQCLGVQNSSDVPHSIIQTADSGYVVTGRGMYTEDLMTVKLDSLGAIVWQSNLGGTSTIIPFETGESIKQTSDGGYIIAGITTSNDLNVSGNHGLGDVWVVKLDSLGLMNWQKCLGGSEWDWGTEIHETNGGYIVTGYTRSIDGMVSGLHGTSFEDFWIVKIDFLGNLLWQKCLGGNLVEESYSSCLTDDGGFMIAGRTLTQNQGDVSGFLGGVDMWVVKLSETTCSITGQAFIDNNSNNVKDSNEAAVTNQLISETGTGALALTQSDGNYILTVSDTGNTVVSPANLNYYTTVPVSHPVYFSAFLQTDPSNDFAFQPTGTFNDLCISITPLGNFRPGMNAYYELNYTNPGTTTLNPIVVFYPDSNLQFVSSLPSPAIVTSDSVIWNLSSLDPYQSNQIVVSLIVNPNVAIGTLINSEALILPLAGDANPSCNQSFWEVEISGPIDPNDILVNRDTLYNWELVTPPYLEYLIRFQNVGNDTAFTVKVVNEIQDALDISSFDFLTASHPVSINFHNAQRIFEFTFNNILLPDSGINEPFSHGFVRYRIKPVTTLAVGDTVINNARIYFDFNDPVYTNDALTHAVLSTQISEIENETNYLIQYPNPVTDQLHILFPDAIDPTEIGIFSLIGKQIACPAKTNLHKNQTEIIFDTSQLIPGIYFIKPYGGKLKAARFIKM